MGGPEKQIPAFAKDFPPDPALDALVDLFEQGNYAAAREKAEALKKSTESASVRSAADEILRRMKPDPLALYLVALSAALLAALAGWYWTHPGPDGRTHEAAPPVVAPVRSPP